MEKWNSTKTPPDALAARMKADAEKKKSEAPTATTSDPSAQPSSAKLNDDFEHVPVPALPDARHSLSHWSTRERAPARTWPVRQSQSSRSQLPQMSVVQVSSVRSQQRASQLPVNSWQLSMKRMRMVVTRQTTHVCGHTH